MTTNPLQFGNEKSRDGRDHSETPTSHDEAEDAEDATPDEKAFVKSTLGFDPAELFTEREHPEK